LRKLILIAALIAVSILWGCSQESALNRIIQDPGARDYLLGQLLTHEDVRAALADTIFADSLCQVDRSREMLLNHILAADTTGDWIIGKLAENPDYKQKMRAASRR
jgi:hypothetical protein